MLIPFLALQAHILSTVSEFKTCRMWNNNIMELLQGTDAVYELPAVFPEFPDPIKWDQLGNGIQIVDPLEIKFHVLHDFYDAQDGTQDQNIDVFALTNKLYNALQDWMPKTFTINVTDQLYPKFAGTYTIPFGAFQRTSELQDKAHPNVYHFIQSYLTTWMDVSRQRPINGIAAPVLNYELDKVVPWDNLSLYLKYQYVTYQGGIYRCILNTTVAHELPTNSTYFIYDRPQN
jgi:hypothetical protein